MTMPHVNSGGNDDIYNSDEVKVYRHEGDEENEKNSSEILSEEKLVLVTETEEAKGGYAGNQKDPRLQEEGKPPAEPRDGPYSYMPGYPGFPNGSTPTSMGGKMPMLQSPLGVMMGYSQDGPFTSPPPAHMGIPPVTLDPKTGLPRPAFPYSGPSQFPHSLYPDVQSWQRPPGYPITSGALAGPYGASFPSGRYPPGLFPPGMPHGMPHPMGAGPNKEGGVSDNHRHGFDGGNQSPQPEKKKPHIKKPLNAFMLFMKEQRAKVVAECTLKESAAINQILGRRWHSLDKEEQAKYYDMARKEKELHLQLHPGWSARDNYGSHVKKKKRKKEEALGLDEGPGECTNNAKKCRARYGMDQQKNWCKPCRRKKKCIRVYEEGGTDGEDGHMSDSPMYGGDDSHMTDSDSMLGSPAYSSASEDLLSTPHKARLSSATMGSPIGRSPLVHDALQGDTSREPQELRGIPDPMGEGPFLKGPLMPSAQSSPYSARHNLPEQLMIPERYASPQGSPYASSHLRVPQIPSMGSPKPPGLSRSFSIESLAKSSITSDNKEKENAEHNHSFDYSLSPLSSPGDLAANSPKFSISTFAEDMNKNCKSKKSGGLSNSFSISTLSVSAVTPNRVHCS